MMVKPVKVFIEYIVELWHVPPERNVWSVVKLLCRKCPTVLAYLRWSTLCLLNGGAHVEPLDGTAIGLWRSCSWAWIRMILRI